MGLITTIGTISGYWAAFIVIVFFWCIASLLRAMHKKKPRIIIVPAVILAVSIVAMQISKRIVVNQLTELVDSNELRVTIAPDTTTEARKLFKDVVTNIYRLKGESGSSPTGLHYLFTICDNSALCATVEIGQDSRQTNMYWISYKPYKSKSFSLHLGFVKLEGITPKGR